MTKEEVDKIERYYIEGEALVDPNGTIIKTIENVHLLIKEIKNLQERNEALTRRNVSLERELAIHEYTKG